MAFWNFYDVHSGGRPAHADQSWLVEADSKTAALVTFAAASGCNPFAVHCTCCGPCWSIWGFENDEQPNFAEYDRVIRKAVR